MGTGRVNPDPPHIAVFAKAPVPGAVKTRLVPAIGARRAARLHRRLVQRAVSVACAAAAGRVTLWCAPDASHRFFNALTRRHAIELAAQRGEDLGARMLHAFGHHAPHGALLLIGSDCPALTPSHLHAAAAALDAGNDAVFIPAEDGGYVLAGMRRPVEAVFTGIDWGTAHVMAQTRAALAASAVRWAELPALWDVDRPDDLARLNDLEPNFTEIA